MSLAAWTHNIVLLLAILPGDAFPFRRTNTHFISNNAHERCIDRWSHTLIDFYIALVIRKDLLVNELLKLFLVLQSLLLLRVCLLENCQVQNVAIVAAILVARWRPYFMFFVEHVLKTVKLLYGFLRIILHRLKSFVLLLDLVARSGG